MVPRATCAHALLGPPVEHRLILPGDINEPFGGGAKEVLVAGVVTVVVTSLATALGGTSTVQLQTANEDVDCIVDCVVTFLAATLVDVANAVDANCWLSLRAELLFTDT